MAIKKIVVEDPDGVLKKLLGYGSKKSFSIAKRGGETGSAAWAGMSQDTVRKTHHKSVVPSWYHRDRSRTLPLEVLSARAKSKRRGVGAWNVGWPADYWYLRFLDTGSGPHRIEGKPRISFRGGVGRFRGRNGRFRNRKADMIHTDFVNHTGMKRRPLLRTLIRKHGSKITEITANAMMKRIEEMAD